MRGEQNEPLEKSRHAQMENSSESAETQLLRFLDIVASQMLPDLLFLIVHFISSPCVPCISL